MFEVSNKNGYFFWNDLLGVKLIDQIIHRQEFLVIY